jgi:uncharacterized membrane protein YdjX (TVP38/TMEM64 family)
MTPPPAKTSRRRRIALRIGLLLLVFAVLYALGKTTGLLDAADLDWIRAKVEAAGAWGVLAYLGIYCVAVVLWVPGLLFALAGIVIYGPWLGAPLALFGAALSSSIQVAVFRRAGGDLLLELDNPLLKRALAQLQDRPIRSVAVLRLFLQLAPYLNTALALAGVRFRPHFVGTLIGITPVIVLMAALVEPILRFLDGKL